MERQGYESIVSTKTIVFDSILFAKGVPATVKPRSCEEKSGAAAFGEIIG